MWRKIPKSVAAFCLIPTMLFAPLTTVFAGRISDYVYDDKAGADGVFVYGHSAAKQIALTFDDGPHAKYTPQILDILKKHGVKATFFVIGSNAEKHPDLILREHIEGHEIGNHTYSHPQLRTTKIPEFTEEIVKTQEIIKGITGKAPELFRPPGGYLNNEFVEKTRSINCTSVLWSWRQDTKDWSNPPVSTIVKTVTQNLRPGDIILFHDFNSQNSPTPEALAIIIPKIKQMGYEFVTVSELMDDGQLIDE